MAALINNQLLKLITALQVRRMEAEEDGQTLVEYALIIALISIAAIVAMIALGGQITAVFNYIVGKLAVGP